MSGQRHGVDDRYVLPVEATRKGAHRARPGVLAAAAPTVGVLIVVGVVLLAAWQVLGNTDRFSGKVATAASSQVSTTPSSSPSASVAAESTTTPPTTTDDATSGTTSGGSLGSVVVLNNTATKGLAKKGGDKLAAAGWTITRTGNYTPRGAISQTTVYYAKSDDAHAAEAVSEALGGVRVKLSSTIAAEGITVVLASDFTG